jgi:hypothetical protein
VSFSDAPLFSWRKKVGCIFYLLASGPFFLFSLATGAFGRCDSDGGCLSLPVFLLLFPGMAILVVAGGVFLALWAMKGDK